MTVRNEKDFVCDYIIQIRQWHIYVDKNTFILLYKAMVRPHLEYANSVWCPYKKGDIERIEKYKKEPQS